ncbi:carotenoid oxygenase family protein [Streptomyces sp. NPDC059837]|uniref:carotenoid oxygenase family protein n=1 Tax=Streptomyces sp. NPDC059837 TaxID=3346968 RepID=UPI00365512EC
MTSCFSCRDRPHPAASDAQAPGTRAAPRLRATDPGTWLKGVRGTCRTSRLLVFAAQEPEAGPVARVRIPVRVPLGPHGCRLPSEERRADSGPRHS